MMSLDDFWHIVYAAVVDFNCIAVETFIKFLISRKMCFVTIEEITETNLLWGGLNDIMFRFHVFFPNLLLVHFELTSSIDFLMHLRIQLSLYQKFLG